MMGKRVVIIGGGLAGLAAAVRLAESEHEVILIETRKKLGGRATSFIDPRSGEVLDNCQHVLMGCCTNLIVLYDRLVVLDSIKWHRTLYWTRGGGEIDEMKAGLLPAPLHFTNAFRRMRIFDRSEKRALARAMWRMIRLGQAGRFAWRERTFASFLQSCDQPEKLICDFWNTIVISACNLDVKRVSASAAMQVFQEGFLANKWSYTMGLANVPLWELYEPAARFIERRGGQIRLGESARSIAYDGNRATGVVTEHELISAPAIIAAVPFDRLDKLVSRTMRTADPRLQNLDKLSVSPILGVHLHFNQPVMPPELPHLILVGNTFSGVQWLFNKSVGFDKDGLTPADSQTPIESRTQHVHAVISCADEWMTLDESSIVERVLRDVHHALPNSKGLDPTRVRAVKEKRATFAATPESERHRPGTLPTTVGSGFRSAGITNLYLAGDWVDTGWPATMEGAVRSGYTAAAAIAAGHIAPHSGATRAGVIEDVPPGTLAALLGLR